jgi:hypothetical protein
MGSCNAVMDIGSYKFRGDSLLTKDLLAAQEGLCSMDLGEGRNSIVRKIPRLSSS